jgi:hypothetical protein
MLPEIAMFSCTSPSTYAFAETLYGELAHSLKALKILALGHQRKVETRGHFAKGRLNFIHFIQMDSLEAISVEEFR